jgi:hypothetical protein
VGVELAEGVEDEGAGFGGPTAAAEGVEEGEFFFCLWLCVWEYVCV